MTFGDALYDQRMPKVKKSELLDRIQGLEHRVRELEARPALGQRPPTELFGPYSAWPYTVTCSARDINALLDGDG